MNAFQSVASALISTAGANIFLHARVLATASNRTVVKPNVDTLYSTLVFDLSTADLVITVPEVPGGRFKLLSYYDPYGNNFANTGTGNLDNAGDYLLRRAAPANVPYGVQVSNSVFSSNTTQYQAYINSPTTHGILLIRWLVQNQSVYDDVHAYQKATLAKPLRRAIDQQTSPTLASLVQRNITGSTSAETSLRLLAAFAPVNPPEITSDVAAVTGNLTAAGIANGTYTPSPGFNLAAANAAALSAIIQGSTSPSVTTTLNNGWSMINPNSTGDFGTNYALRAGVASAGYLMLKAPNALYPSWSNTSASTIGSATQLNLAANESLLYTFSAKPPLLATGFWSLTAYSDNYLIPNTANVYALGDRSNLTYSSGELVYPSNAFPSAASDPGVFQILVQAADVPPPANWTANWLPAPAGGGYVSPLLRWYGATDALTDGVYVYPLVTRQGAIRGTAAGSGSATAMTVTTMTTTSGTGGATISATGVPATFTGGAALAVARRYGGAQWQELLTGACALMGALWY